MPKGSWKEFDQDQIKPNSPSLVKAVSSLKRNHPVSVKTTRAGKKGKIVTEITGLNLDSSECKELLKVFKSKCGTGGTMKKDVMELQGDQSKIVLEVLKQKGLIPNSARD